MHNDTKKLAFLESFYPESHCEAKISLISRATCGSVYFCLRNVDTKLQVSRNAHNIFGWYPNNPNEIMPFPSGMIFAFCEE